MTRLELRKNFLKEITTMSKCFFVEERNIEKIKCEIKKCEEALKNIQKIKTAVKSGLIEMYWEDMGNYHLHVRKNEEDGKIFIFSKFIERIENVTEGDRYIPSSIALECLEKIKCKISEILEENKSNLAYWTEPLELFFRDSRGRIRKLK